MTKEEIKKMAEEIYPIVEIGSLIVEIQHRAFTAGAEWAAGEYEKFMIWASSNGWRHWEGYGWELNFNGEYIITSELYQIFKQQKP
jgi:hypothetical protein